MGSSACEKKTMGEISVEPVAAVFWLTLSLSLLFAGLSLACAIVGDVTVRWRGVAAKGGGRGFLSAFQPLTPTI